MEEKISIVVPVYKVAQFIAECLDSLINQSWRNLEIICVDDASPDCSKQIIEAYIQKDERIKLLTHHSNLGLGSARNTGMQYASGSYICFVDSDDYVDARFVELLYSSITHNNSDVVACGFSLFNAHRTKQARLHYGNETHHVLQNKQNVLQLSQQIRSAAWLKIYRRDFLINNAISFTAGYYEDVLFWLTTIYCCNNISTISDSLYFYRERSDSIMTTLTSKHIDDRINYIQQIESFYIEQLQSVASIDQSILAADVKQCMLGHINYGYELFTEVVSTDALRTYYHQQIKTTFGILSQSVVSKELMNS